MAIIIVVPSVLGLVVCFSLCIWITHQCATRRSGSKDEQNSGTSFRTETKRFYLSPTLDLLSGFYVSCALLFAPLVWFLTLIFCTDTSKGGASLVPMLNKFNSFMNGKKGSISVMDYAVLESATDAFNSSNILGEGGSGCVYKARFDHNLFAAVKRLDNAGPDCQREFEVLSPVPVSSDVLLELQ